VAEKPRKDSSKRWLGNQSYIATCLFYQIKKHWSHARLRAGGLVSTLKLRIDSTSAVSGNTWREIISYPGNAGSWIGLIEIASLVFHSVAASIFTQPQSCSESGFFLPSQQEERSEVPVSLEKAQQHAGLTTQIAKTTAKQR
jgi:hypothetical protein